MVICKNTVIRGAENPQNDEYDNTVAGGSGSGGATTAALILEDIPCYGYCP